MKSICLSICLLLWVHISHSQLPDDYSKPVRTKIYKKLPLVRQSSTGEYVVTVIGDKCFLGGDMYVGDTIMLNRYQVMQFSLTHDDWINNSRWPSAIVPFNFAPGFTREEKITIINAMNHIARNTHISFRKKNILDANYIHFVMKTEEELGFCGGHSWVGRALAGGQDIVFSCLSEPVAIHEIGHALGLYHEQSREDRDDFVKILWDNIEPFQHGNFFKLTADATDNGNYDLGSIMHYRWNTFGKKIGGTRLRTIENSFDPSDKSFGRSAGLSRGDIMGINSMYRTDANLPLVNLPPLLSPGEMAVNSSRNVSILAKNIYNFPNLFVERGQRYRFTCTATDKWKNGTININANGYEPGFFDGTRRQGSFDMMTLVAEVFRINGDITSYTGTNFKVGTSREWTATETGFMNFFANDCLTCYFDNSGSILVTIKRLQ